MRHGQLANELEPIAFQHWSYGEVSEVVAHTGGIVAAITPEALITISPEARPQVYRVCDDCIYALHANRAIHDQLHSFECWAARF